MPSLAIGALLAAGAATVAASAAFTAGGFLLFSKAAAVFFAKRFLLVATLGYVIQKSVKKPSKPGDGAGQVRGSTQLAQDSVIPKRWILGRSRVTGAYIWHRHLDSRLAMVFMLGDGPMDSIERIWVDGEEVELTRGTGDNSNVLTPASGSRFNFLKAVTRTETYTEIVGGDGEGEGGGGGDDADPDSRPSTPTPPDRIAGPPALGPQAPPTDRGPEGPGNEGEGGHCAGCSTGSLGPGPGPTISDGRELWIGGVSQWRPGALNMSPAAIARYEAAATVGAAGTAAGGQQGEGGGNVDPTTPMPNRNYRRVTRQRTITTEVSTPAIKITEYFKADGTEGARIREIAAESIPDDAATETTRDNELEWTAEHKLNGISYVLVEFEQPAHENTTDGVQGRFYNRLPTVEFQVKGLKVSYPVADASAQTGRRLTAPAWTDNAAILRYWFLTERRDVNPLRIDLDYFEAARLKCDEDLSLASHDEYRDDYPGSVKRYTINGVVNSGDSAQSLERQFDLCWQGEAVQWNGGFLFRPGGEMTPRLVVREEDVIAEPVVRPTLPRERRANEVSIVLEQSEAEDFRQAEFRIVDDDRQAADDERLPADIGTQSFLNQPVQAINIMHQALRAQTSSMQVDIKVHPGDDFRYIGLVPGDKIELQLSEFGIGQGDAPAPGTDAAASEVRYFRVASSSVNQDMSVDLRLTQWPDGWYEDRFEFPEIRQRTLLIPAPVYPPTGRPSITHSIDQNGNTFWEAIVYFEPSPHRTICWIDSPLNNWQEQEARNGYVRFELKTPGTYTFYAYNLSSDGRASNTVSSTATADYQGIPLPLPQVISANPLGRDIQILMRNIPNRDVAGAEVKYTRGALDADLTTLPAITEDEWDGALEMSVQTSLPRSAGQPIHASARFPASGSYRVYMRLVSAVDTLSPVVEVGVFRYELQGADVVSRNAFPSWPGTEQNMVVWPHDENSRLLPDRANINAVSFDEWDGAPDWPFGQNTGFGSSYESDHSTAYLTRVFTLGDATTSREVTIFAETDAPTGVINDVAGVDIVLLHSTGDNLQSPTAQAVVDGQPVIITAQTIQARVHLRNTRSRAIISLIVGWRDLA